MAGRNWTLSEEAIVRRDYSRRSAPEIGAEVGRSAKAVQLRAVMLGLSRPKFRWTRKALATLKVRNRAGWSDTAIARELECERHTVSKRRIALNLPDQSKGIQSRSAISAGVQRQIERLGVPDLARLRVAAWAADAIDKGWPLTVADRPINRRHIAILETLYHHGPQTRRQIAERIGMRWLGSRRSLKCRGPHGSYLGQLIADGLVVQLGRVIAGKSKGKSVNLYALTPATEKQDHAE